MGLISASLLELFLFTLPVDKRDGVKTVLVQILTAGGFLSRKVFSEQYSSSRNALVKSIFPYAINIAREFTNGANSTPRIDDLLRLNEPLKAEQFTSRYNQDFEEVEEIGVGGFGRVFRSRSRVDNQYYAIKKITLKESTEKHSKKIVDECRFHAVLQHPNVVRYHNAWFEIKITEVEEVVDSKITESFQESEESLVVKKWVSKTTSVESENYSVSSEESKKGFWATPQKPMNPDSPFVTFGSSEGEEDEEEEDNGEDDCGDDDDDDDDESDLSDGSGSSIGSASARKLAKQLAKDDDIEEVKPRNLQLALDFTKARTKDVSFLECN